MTGQWSGGCLTCRKRKVKCDEGRPLCDRCSRGKFQCWGYDKVIHFVEDGPDASSSRLRHAGSRTHKLLSIRERGLHTRERFVRAIQPCSRALSLSAFSSNIFVSYLVDRVRHEGGPLMANIWAQHQGDLSTSGLALDALAQMFFGRTHGELSMVCQATQKYGAVLQRIRKDLMGSQAWSLDTLLAITSLAMYELIAMTQVNAWTQHANGLAKVMEMHGPTAYQELPLRDLFIHNRVLLISEAIMSRKHTFLARDSWKSIPWLSSWSSKNMADYLFDIGSDVAGFLEDLDIFEQTKTSRVPLATLPALISSMQNCFCQLDSWWNEWASKLTPQCRSVPCEYSATICLDAHGLFFARRLHFDSFWACFVLMAYNALRIQLLDTHDQLKHHGPLAQLQLHSTRPSTVPLGLSDDADALSKEIMKCLDYCQTQSQQFVGNFSLLFPFYVTGSHYEAGSRESLWFCQVCRFTDDSPILRGYMSGKRRVSVERYQGLIAQHIEIKCSA